MRRALLSAALILQGSALAVGSTSCHLHPPGSTPQSPINIIGPFSSVRECEQQRGQQFGNAGYCHCGADFTPDWKRLEPAPSIPPGGLL